MKVAPSKKNWQMTANKQCINKIIASGDKTCNLYKVEKEDYKKYLKEYY